MGNGDLFPFICVLLFLFCSISGVLGYAEGKRAAYKEVEIGLDVCYLQLEHK